MTQISVLSSHEQHGHHVLLLACGHRAYRRVRKGRKAPTFVKSCDECDGGTVRVPIQFKNPANPEPAKPHKAKLNTPTPKVPPMRVEILQGGRVLPHHCHNGKSYIEAPSSGEYQLRLTNTSHRRRLAVISVDGVNVVDGETAGFDGTGYVLGAYQSTLIKGWRRSDSEVAAFQFKTSEASYAAQTGRGTSNTGVIGVAVYDEKPKPRILRGTRGIQDTLIGCPISTGTRYSPTTLNSGEADLDFAMGACSPAMANCSEGGEVVETTTTTRTVKTRGRRRHSPKSTAPNIGTGYGVRTTMHTTETTFERATETPILIITLRYGVRAKLIEWGVPLPEVHTTPSAFPASESPSVAPPPGWRG